MGEATEAGVNRAIREIAATTVDDDGLVFDVDTLEVHAIREDNRYGGLRAVMQARLGQARIHVQIDVGFAAHSGHRVIALRELRAGVVKARRPRRFAYAGGA